MTKKKISILPIILLACLLSILACFNSNKTVYVSSPARTIALDSVSMDLGPFKFKPEADSFLVDFFVPGDSNCPVKIEFLSSAHKLERLIADSVYSPGSHHLTWSRVDPKGGQVEYYRAYYYQITICDSTYTKSFYYRKEVY